MRSSLSRLRRSARSRNSRAETMPRAGSAERRVGGAIGCFMQPFVCVSDLWSVENAVNYWLRFEYMSSRDLGVGALMALVAAVVLDKTGPTVGFNAFCVGMLFGLAIGVGMFALTAFVRERKRGR